MPDIPLSHQRVHLDSGRTRLKLRAWLAGEDGRAVGCIVAQLFDGLLGPARLDEIGYIAGVCVSDDHRQQVRRGPSLNIASVMSTRRICGSGRGFPGTNRFMLTRWRQPTFQWRPSKGDARMLQGVGKLLTNQAVEYLRSLKCTRVMLHAAPAAKPVYKPLQIRRPG